MDDRSAIVREQAAIMQKSALQVAALSIYLPTSTIDDNKGITASVLKYLCVEEGVHEFMMLRCKRLQIANCLEKKKCLLSA